MKVCACGQSIPVRMTINGKQYNLQNRTRCLNCVPFKNPRIRKSINNNARYKAWYDQEKLRLGRDPIGLKRAQRKEYIIKLLGSRCQFCPYSKCIANLSFHHLIPKDKSGQINCQYKLSRVLDELRKCVLSCHNCHGEIHAGLIPAVNVEIANQLLNKLVKPLESHTWADLGLDYPPIAQLAERRPSDPDVAGSSPAGWAGEHDGSI